MSASTSGNADQAGAGEAWPSAARGARSGKARSTAPKPTAAARERPAVAAETVVEPATGEGVQAHADRLQHEDSAVSAAHGPRAEVFPRLYLGGGKSHPLTGRGSGNFREWQILLREGHQARGNRR